MTILRYSDKQVCNITNLTLVDMMTTDNYFLILFLDWIFWSREDCR